ncbi:hypothetical protein CIL05_04655 [Virgibacillus profundi]|uniref:Sigma factor regulator C-terminal domain-containing protein n=1 Tax=Virgibacillus profundi TaxID=2024555 RepID=A0A2A2IIC2_9BACI|nr:anti sigma factor C-terminal domain-containing protein [Virgibacillus profundi]PAV31004.1 hypothetical protein CIL05_04655 [Virgibacillus profundi]PXY55189.1 hypothetical protein CIT14_04740 [Virgibacillus profundi]
MKKDDVLTEWNEKEVKVDKKSARKLVWKTRLSITYTVIRVLFIIFFLYLLYIIPVSVFYDMSGKQAEFDRLVTTIVETRNPGIAVDKLDFRRAEINPFLTQETSLTLYRNIGEWEVVVGEVTAKKTLFGEVKINLDFDRRYLNESNTQSYAVAPDLLGETYTENNGHSSNLTLSQLEKMNDGFVAQIQFSTIKSMTPEELINILSDYDVQVYQMPIYGGELTDSEVSNYMGYGRAGQFTFVSSLMLRPFIEYDEKNRQSSSIGTLSGEGSIDEAESQFYQDMEWLIENGNYQDKELDKARLAYIKENGMQVYGATVTGPIREVERLMDEELFHQFHLGGVEIWNWYE